MAPLFNEVHYLGYILVIHLHAKTGDITNFIKNPKYAHHLSTRLMNELVEHW